MQCDSAGILNATTFLSPAVPAVEQNNPSLYYLTLGHLYIGGKLSLAALGLGHQNSTLSLNSRARG